MKKILDCLTSVFSLIAKAFALPKNKTMLPSTDSG